MAWEVVSSVCMFLFFCNIPPTCDHLQLGLCFLVLVWKNCLGFSVGYQRAPGTSEKKKPRTSERFVANCRVGQRWSAMSWGSAVGLKVSARCSDVCTVAAQAVMNLSQLAESDARREEAQLRVRHHAALIAGIVCRIWQGQPLFARPSCK